MPAPLKVTDEQLVAAYEETGSVWKAGAVLGIGGQSVHERLVKIGKAKPMNTFTDEERDYLKINYAAYANTGRLSDLAEKMGRAKQFLCRQARELGLTDQKRKRHYISTWKYMPEETAQVIWDDFKASRLGMGAYCRKHGYDDLGFSKRMKELFYDEYEHVIELKVPKQNLYRLGRAFEYRVRDKLKEAGYFVMRSPQSRSAVDLLAVATGMTLMVQCKRHGAIGVEEWNKLFDLARSTGAKPILAAMGKNGHGVELYEMTGRKDGTKRAQPMVPFSL